MKKIVGLLTALMLAAAPGFAQTKVALSQPFEEPNDGWNKLLQLRNGNTFFLHFTREGIGVTVYGKDHKVISEKTVTSELWNPRKMKETVIEGLHEINGEPVVFLHQLRDRTPTLYRIRLDANTGAVVKEKEMGTIERYKAGAAWAMAYGKVDVSDFHIEKDPASDHYAVAYFNGFAGESGKRIEVVHYSGEHKILRRAYYFDSTQPAPFKYLRYLGMTVNGSKAVHLSAYGFNTERSGGQDSRVIVSRLDERGSFRHKMLEFSDDFLDTKAVMRYNPSMNLIQMMTITQLKKKRSNTTYYLSLLTSIDPESLTPVFTKPLVDEKVGGYLSRYFDYDEGYSGMPQNMSINADGSTTVLSEEMTVTTMTNGTGAVVSQSTQLGAIGVSMLDERGAETDGYAVVKKQQSPGYIPPLYIAGKEKGFWESNGGMRAGTGSPFMSYDYVDSKAGRFILFNDYPANLKRENSRKRKPVVAISDAHTVCYRMEGDKATPSFPFGNPEEGKVTNFTYIESSHYQPATNTYATLLVKRDHRDKQAYVAWLSFE